MGRSSETCIILWSNISRVDKLCGKDWYRLRRTLEVAYTVTELQKQNNNNNNKKEDDISKELEFYTGQRSGGLLSSGPDDTPKYDVRCFFLCPNDRMAHTSIIDTRCEQMLLKGLVTETTDLRQDGKLPLSSQPARAIGYRQTLDYLYRSEAKSKDEEALDQYIEDFTTATRRYAKKQMSWFRKDDSFMFVPVQVLDERKKGDDENEVETKEATMLRVEKAAGIITEMCLLSREEYEKQLLMTLEGEKEGTTTTTTNKTNDKQKGAVKTSKKEQQKQREAYIQQLPLSAQTKIANEEQGKQMKFYKPQRYIIQKGTKEYEDIMLEVDQCTKRIQGLNDDF